MNSSSVCERRLRSQLPAVDMAPAPVKLVPISPENSQRYERNRTIERCRTDYAVQPLTRSFSPEPCPPQWRRYQHPEGGVYFVHAQWHIFTDAYLYEKTSLVQITSAVEQLLARTGVYDLLESGQIDIGLDLMEETPVNSECGYYFVDHSARIVFWLDVFNMSQLTRWNLVPGIQTKSHVKMGLEIEYWLHCEYYPAALSMSSRLVHELRSTIIHGIGDAMTSPTSTIPFPVDHMFRMLTLADGIMDEVAYNPGEINGVAINHGPIAVFGRFMKRFAIERFHHFHGERTARMDVAQSVYQYTPKRSYLITCVSPLLFNAPYTRLRAIEAMYLDQWLNYPLWHTLFTGLRSEWHELVLYGTLILNTNVGLLALPARGVAAAAQLSSYISICFGLGSIITGLVLLRLYRSETQDAPNTNKGVAFFRRQSKLVYGFEVLAIFYAMPFGFMVWGMITFILAFLLQMSTGETRGIVFAITSFLVLGITACVWTERSFVWPEGIADIASAVKSSLSRMREGCWSRRGEAEKDLDGADNIV